MEIQIDLFRWSRVIARLLLGVMLVGMALAFVGAPAQASPVAPARPLGELLNPNGTLNLTTGFRGSIDARGWQLVSGPNETPRFAPVNENTPALAPNDAPQSAPSAAPNDQRWASNFSIPGTDSQIMALAVDRSDNLFLGGTFSTAGNALASYIAKWTGSAFSTVGSNGTNDWPLALVTDGNGILYAGGWFGWAQSPTRPVPQGPQVGANFVARWDGTSWSNLGTGMNDLVLALAVDSSNNLYAGGVFTTAGGATVNRIAKWNGSAWSALGNGVSSTVSALAVDSSNNVYAGGAFVNVCGNAACNAGNVPVNRIAKWNGSAWSALGNGVSGQVSALAVDSGNNVFAGGSFVNVCGNAACNAGNVLVNFIAKWNGAAWSTLSNGVSSTVSALAVDSSNNVFAGGAFQVVCGNAACNAGNVRVNYIAKWNGSAWSALGNGVNGGVSALARDSSNNIYAGGGFAQICGNTTCDTNNTTSNFIAKWNGASWSLLGSGDGADSTVNALARDSSGSVYAGGNFNRVDGLVANHIARWSGSAWSALGFGFDNAVDALAVDSSNNVYAGGTFLNVCGNAACNAGNVLVNRIAKWNGAAWSALGNGFDNQVNALAVDSSNNVYAGGAFLNVCGNAVCGAGNVLVNRIAKWNGSAWSALGFGVDNTVNALAVDSSNNVFAGGAFANVCGNAACNAGNVPVDFIAKWNGAAWSTLSGGTSGTVRALAVDSSNNVYAGGDFTGVGPVGGYRIHVALWDGAVWRAVGFGLDNTVNTLVVDGTNVYAGGSFVNVCGNGTCSSGNVQANRVAKWDGSGWSPLGSGTNSAVNALVMRDKNLYVGGAFVTAGGKVSRFIARYVAGELFLPIILR